VAATGAGPAVRPAVAVRAVPAAVGATRAAATAAAVSPRIWTTIFRSDRFRLYQTKAPKDDFGAFCVQGFEVFKAASAAKAAHAFAGQADFAAHAVGFGPFRKGIDGQSQALRHGFAQIEAFAGELDLVAILFGDFDLFVRGNGLSVRSGDEAHVECLIDGNRQVLARDGAALHDVGDHPTGCGKGCTVAGQGDAGL
jgi:hypothetical protein